MQGFQDISSAAAAAAAAAAVAGGHERRPVGWSELSLMERVRRGRDMGIAVVRGSGARGPAAGGADQLTPPAKRHCPEERQQQHGQQQRLAAGRGPSGAAGGGAAAAGGAAAGAAAAGGGDQDDVMNISLKDLTGGKLEFKVRSTTRLQKILDAYCSAKGIVAEDAYLIFKGRRLSVDLACSDYGVEDGDVLHVLIRLAGD